jgi:hypothetical protein
MKQHLLFHGAQSTLNSAVRSKTRRSVAVGHMEISGGMAGVRAGEQESFECCVKEGPGES